MKIHPLLLAGGAALVFAGAGCSNSTPTATGSTGRAVVAITDDATSLGNVSAVNVTIDKVELHDANDGTITVASVTKTYDLVQLKNTNVLKLLADENVAAGTYDQVRLTISKVEVKTADGASHIAKLPSNVLKINGNFTVNGGETSTAVLDFDLNASLHVTGTGQYILAPVVHFQTKENAEVQEGTGDEVEIKNGTVDTDEDVGEDVTGETRENFELPEKLDVDAEGHVEIGD